MAAPATRSQDAPATSSQATPATTSDAAPGTAPAATGARTVRAPFPVPASAVPSAPADAARAVKPLLIIRGGDPTPDEIAAVTAAILAVLPRRAPRPPLTPAPARRARWTPPASPSTSWLGPA
ncbi:acyl-CoA carboxylase epsilon subunit [Streptomyces bungoensis]|uniref:acyl-CoA carboxylase epsilon subunit n=1 Tax=Streptomyces bungoensis TaxID=285568 RepID=UPI00131D150D|nr:acyl-CoA carboxylase epsilon subunit [Streptomyces bungoensis]